MSRPVAVLRPEPGNSATVAAIRAAGGTALSLPLFHIVPLAWTAPDPAGYDALVVTSANAIRHGGTDLLRLRSLPVHAVGAATARTASDAGFDVEQVGERDAASLVATIPPGTRLLHLAGRERAALPGVDALSIYAAEPTADIALAVLEGTVAMLHSARAARRLAMLVPPPARSTIRIAAISPAVASAAGEGWERVANIPQPSDARLVSLAITLAD